MMDSLLRAYEAKIDDVDRASRSVVAKINTGAVDRYRTVIDPAGIDLSAYNQNRVVLWEHGRDPTRGSLPIGKNKWITANRNGNGSIIARTQFATDAYSQTLFDMYEDETLRGWSVNVLPDMRRTSPPTKEEIRARPDLATCELMYRATELTEYSAVAVPGNRETLTLLKERGIWIPDVEFEPEPEPEPEEEPSADGEIERDAAPVLPPLEGLTYEEITRQLSREVNEYYKRRLDQIHAAFDLLRGRV